MKEGVTRKRIEMPHPKKEQGPMGQSCSGVWEMGKGGRRTANTGGSALVSLATTSLLSPIPLKFLPVNSQEEYELLLAWLLPFLPAPL